MTLDGIFGRLVLGTVGFERPLNSIPTIGRLALWTGSFEWHAHKAGCLVLGTGGFGHHAHKVGRTIWISVPPIGCHVCGTASVEHHAH